MCYLQQVSSCQTKLREKEAFKDLVLTQCKLKCQFVLQLLPVVRLVSSMPFCVSVPVLQSQRGVSQHHEVPMMNFTEGHHHHHDDGEEEDLDGVWKGLTALSGVYFMFLIEHFLTLGKMYKDKKQKVRVGSDFFSCLLLYTVICTN